MPRHQQYVNVILPYAYCLQIRLRAVSSKYRRESEDAERVVAGYERDLSNAKLADDGVPGGHPQLDRVAAVGQRQSAVTDRERGRLGLIAEPGAELNRP